MDDINDLDILYEDLFNTYLQLYTKDNIDTIADTEFGEELKGRILIIVR